MHLFDDCLDFARANVQLEPLTWFGLGGAADWVVAPRDATELALVIRRCREAGEPVYVLGKGANVLAPDEGLRGVVLRLSAPEFCRMQIDGKSLLAGGGVDLTRLTVKTVKAGLAGLECLAGIPGTVGGGIRMNCGGRFGEIGSAVRRVKLMLPDGRTEWRGVDQLNFGYRRCELGEGWVVEAEFALQLTDPEALHRKFREIWEYKKDSQPAMGAHSAGCIFRNPPGETAGALIDRTGLKGLRMGRAFVSLQHANFIMADEGAKSADVVNLIEVVQQRVQESFGIGLETEVKIWSNAEVCC